MSNELTVLKLGGSLLTDKKTPYVVRTEVLKSVAHEIKECIDMKLIQSLVLIHGVGSYGHPPVLKHKLHKGYHSPDQLLPLSKTQESVSKLRHMIVQQLQDVEIPVCLMCPSSMVLAEKMRMTEYFLGPLKGFFSLGMVPLLGGDILIDSVMGWSVGSGDQLAVIIAKEMNAKRMVFASDVAGIYNADPKLNPNASRFDEINLNELERVFERMGESGVVDASGAMKGKINSVIPAKDLIKQGLEVSIISMMKSGNLKALLNGDESKSTQIVVK